MFGLSKNIIRNVKISNLVESHLWYQDTRQALTWIEKQCHQYHGGFTRWEKAYKCIWDSFVEAERSVLDWRL